MHSRRARNRSLRSHATCDRFSLPAPGTRAASSGSPVSGSTASMPLSPARTAAQVWAASMPTAVTHPVA
ncbi:hypothetical protein [Variovorax sp. OAS795]|uniref:hypothetical protein n=1 Tax=Variovorax sp. OAS795 TaxID=3034231 RepID=UPI00339511DE